MPKNVDHLRKEDTARNYDGSFFTYEGNLYYSAVPDNGVVSLRPVAEDGEILGRARMRLDFKADPVLQAKLKAPKPFFVVADNKNLYYVYRTSNRQYLFGLSRANAALRTYKMFAGKLSIGDQRATDILYDMRFLVGMRDESEIQFNPKENVQRLSRRCAVYFSSLLYDGIEVGTIKKGVAKLHPEFDDSLMYFDLRKLGVPL